MSHNPVCYGPGVPNLAVAPKPIVSLRDPATTDIEHPIGQVWIDTANSTFWVLVDVAAGVATWVNATTAGGIMTITGNSGGAESPSAGNFNILGTGSITSVGTANTETVQLTGLTNHNVLVGAGTATITKVAPSATAGVPLVSAGAAADPAFGTAVVAGGGTGAVTLTAHGVLVGEGTSPVVGITAGATGEVLAGNTGADPAFTASPTITTLTATTIHGTTIDTNVAAAELSLNGTTIAATGSDADVSLNLTTKGTGSVVFAQSKAGVDQNMQITNSDNTAAAGNAGLQLAVGGSTSTGDPYVSFQISGVGASTMTMGLDNSASDLFVISNSTALGTSNALTLTQAGALNATTSVTAGTSVTATAGDITATLGNVILNGAAKQLRVHGGAVTDFIGQAVLVNGVVTVANTNIAATDRIFVTRSAKNASTAYGVFLTDITGATSFTITSCKSDTTTETNDQSTVDYFIVRQV